MIGRKQLWRIVISVMFVGLISSATVQAQATENVVTVDVIRNGFALGVNNDHCPTKHDPAEEPISAAEWTFDEYITLSKCGLSKNSHPTDPNGGGAMFKNGPIENSGRGYPGVPAHMWQTYDLVALGVPAGTAVTVDITLELISVGGTDFTAVIETSHDGQNWTPAVTLIDFPLESCGEWKYPLYCGNAVVVYAPYYRLALTSVWEEQLGQKWVIHSLNFSYEAASLVMPTVAETAVPITMPLLQFRQLLFYFSPMLWWW